MTMMTPPQHLEQTIEAEEEEEEEEEDKYYLCKKDQFKIEFDGGIVKTLDRKPMLSREIKEIEKLQNQVRSFRQNIEVYRVIARYCLGITDDKEFDTAIWEDDPKLIKNNKIFGIKSVLDACILRSINGTAYYSPELEEWILYDSKIALAKLNVEVIEAWNMFMNKQHGIMPNQYHHFYQQGDTLIYPEHIADLITIDKMWNEKLKIERRKEEQKQKNKNLGVGGGDNKSGGGFYGQKFRYK